MPRQLSVELLKDIETPEVNPMAMVHAVRYINQLTEGTLRIVASRQEYIKLTKTGRLAIDYEEVRDYLTPSYAAMRLILTDRTILLENSHKLGYTDTYRTQDYIGTAVISTYDTKLQCSQATTAHELGHLFGLAYNDGSQHCGDEDCLMTTSVSYDTKIHPVSGEVYQTARHNPFCESCIQQLSLKAFLLIERYGEE